MKEHAAALHEAAMDLADQAFLAKNPSRSRELFRSALEKEREAAEVWAKISGQEPTRSVLYRSAAALAVDCEEYGEAELLIKRGLTGNPPDDIAEELKELLEVVYTKNPRLKNRENQDRSSARRNSVQEPVAVAVARVYSRESSIEIINETDRDARVRVAGGGAGGAPRRLSIEADDDTSNWPLLGPGGRLDHKPLPPGPWMVYFVVNGRRVVREIRSTTSTVRLTPAGRGFWVKVDEEPAEAEKH
jgi:hypothetical protein